MNLMGNLQVWGIPMFSIASFLILWIQLISYGPVCDTPPGNRLNTFFVSFALEKNYFSNSPMNLIPFLGKVCDDEEYVNKNAITCCDTQKLFGVFEHFHVLKNYN